MYQLGERLSSLYPPDKHYFVLDDMRKGGTDPGTGCGMPENERDKSE
jgi:hypothetical protein